MTGVIQTIICPWCLAEKMTWEGILGLQEFEVFIVHCFWCPGRRKTTVISHDVEQEKTVK